jgi:CRP-like cAMP-binding protein
VFNVIVGLLYDDAEVLAALAGRFAQREVAAGVAVVESGSAVDSLFVVAHGRLARSGANRFDEHKTLGVVSDGDFFGEQGWTHPEPHGMSR